MTHEVIINSWPHERRYYTVNVTVENQDGELYTVFRSQSPYEDIEKAIEDSLRVVLDAPIDFDRMDE